jgi:membrane fusion protein, heavy metal efflux system
VLSVIHRGLTGLFRAIPTLVVGAALCGLFYWGHTTNWTAPKFSELFAGEPGNNGDYDKKPTGKEPDGPTNHAWCEKHNLPEEQCVICHPELAAKSATPAELKPVSVTFDPSAVPTHDPRSCKLLTARVRFASEEALRKSGLRVDAVREQPMAGTVSATASLDYDPDRVAKLGPRAGGIVTHVLKDLGEKIKAGEVIAIIDAPDVGKAKADYVQSVVQVQSRTRARDALRTASAPDRSIAEAESALRDAQVHLYTTQQALIGLGLPVRDEGWGSLPVDELTRKVQFLGLPADLTSGLPTNTTTANLLPVAAPFAGELVDRAVVAGEVAAARQVILTVADTSRLHAHVDVSPDAAAVMRLGQPVEFRADGDFRAVARGKLNWISPSVDEKTRLLHLHAEFDNQDGRLKVKAFGTALITVRAAPKAVIVPEESVQWEGCSHIVFVKYGDLEYRVRRVNVGMRQGGVVEILSGVVPGEMVVTTGSHVLKSELLKDRIGGGED